MTRMTWILAVALAGCGTDTDPGNPFDAAETATADSLDVSDVAESDGLADTATGVSDSLDGDVPPDPDVETDGHDSGATEEVGDSSGLDMEEGFDAGACTDGCEGRECGYDDCGNPCGPCPSDQICRIDGTCSTPEAQCADGFCEIPTFQGLLGIQQCQGGEFRADGYDLVGPTGPVSRPWVVRLSRPYVMQQLPVTQGEWIEAMGSLPPGSFAHCGDSCPVTGMTVFEAMDYANRQSEAEGLPSCYELHNCEVDKEWGLWNCESATPAGLNCGGYRLPSAPEFEAAARAGATGTFWGEAEHQCIPEVAACVSWAPLNKLGWHCGNSSVDYPGCSNLCTDSFPPPDSTVCCGPHSVGQKPANPYGLHDMKIHVRYWTESVDFDRPIPSLLSDPGHAEEMRSSNSLVYRVGSPFFAKANEVAASTGTAGSIGPIHLKQLALGKETVGLRLVRTVHTPAR